MEAKADILELIEDAILQISFGSVTLIIQDGKLVQMEKVEKVRFVDKPLKQTGKAKLSPPGLRNRVLASVQGLQFGQVAFVIKDGAVVQIERTEKRRTPSLEGVYGEGI